MTVPLGFALNPRKYLFGLARAQESVVAGLLTADDLRVVNQLLQ